MLGAIVIVPTLVCITSTVVVESHKGGCKMYLIRGIETEGSLVLLLLNDVFETCSGRTCCARYIKERGKKRSNLKKVNK